jgi:hypothetical protein
MRILGPYFGFNWFYNPDQVTPMLRSRQRPGVVNFGGMASDTIR